MKRTHWEVRGDRYVSRRVGEETILLDVENGRYYTLNEAAATIYEGMVQDRSSAEICRAVLERFSGVDKSAAVQDIREIAAQLKRAGIIQSLGGIDR